MRLMAVVCGVVVMLIVVANAAAAEYVLAEDSKSTWRIVVAKDADPAVKFAAEELQSHLEQITGVRLPISGTVPEFGRHICISVYKDLKWGDHAAGPDGYWLFEDGDLNIIGGSPRGALYGVYGFLEDQLGCRWFAPGVSRIPKQPKLTISNVKFGDFKSPVLEYREPFTFDCFDGDWCARNRVNSSAGRLTEKHGGKVRFGNGFFCHTFNRLVPPDKYFAEHPEYFSLVKDKEGKEKRIKDHSQLCCTNEDVIRLCTEGIRAAMKADPSATVFSVSQNDWANYCQCEKCQALVQAEGSQMAPVLNLVNRVAEAVEKDFPDKAVETLAYQWTRKAPQTMRPRPNVVVRLCSIECCFSHPLATCDSPANKAFCADAAAWAKVGNRLWVWDYVTDFHHYLLPFPNQRVRNDNIRFFIANNVKGIFEQDTYDTPSSELAALGGYLTAKFLWNPNYDENTAINEFLEGYYGAAAGPIRQYIDLLHDRVEKENIHVTIWAPVTSPHLTDELLVKANELWQQAEDLTKDKPEVQARVKTSRLSVDYAIIERAVIQAGKKPPRDETLLPLARQRKEVYLATLKASGVTKIKEYQPLNFDAYQQRVSTALQPPALSAPQP